MNTYEAKNRGGSRYCWKVAGANNGTILRPTTEANEAPGGKSLRKSCTAVAIVNKVYQSDTAGPVTPPFENYAQSEDFLEIFAAWPYSTESIFLSPPPSPLSTNQRLTVALLFVRSGFFGSISVVLFLVCQTPAMYSRPNRGFSRHFYFEKYLIYFEKYSLYFKKYLIYFEMSIFISKKSTFLLYLCFNIFSIYSDF